MRSITLIGGLAVLILLSACTGQVTAPVDASQLTPVGVVTTYYESWDARDYATMYSLISDGFKDLEPTAKDFDSFTAYMDSYFDTAKGITIISVVEATQNGDSATVDYAVALDLNAGSKPFSGAYTLRKRATGWKLIHPYGDFIDTT